MTEERDWTKRTSTCCKVGPLMWDGLHNAPACVLCGTLQPNPPASPVPSVEATTLLRDFEESLGNALGLGGPENYPTSKHPTFVRYRALRARLLSALRSEAEPSEDTDNADSVALEVLCRVFDDGADEGIEEWREWYGPAEWLHWSRALGAFIRHRLDTRPAARSSSPEDPT